MTFLPSPVLKKGQKRQFCQPGHWPFTVFEGGMYLLMGVRAMNCLEITCPLKHSCKNYMDTVGLIRVLYVCLV